MKQNQGFCLIEFFCFGLLRGFFPAAKEQVEHGYGAAHVYADGQAGQHLDQQGKGAGYERWAKVYNLKQMSETFLFMREKHIESFEDLYEKTDAAVARFNDVSSRIKAAESQMAANLALQKHIQNYAKTRDVYEAYRKSGYSKKFFEEHRAEITLYKA